MFIRSVASVRFHVYPVRCFASRGRKQGASLEDVVKKLGGIEQMLGALDTTAKQMIGRGNLDILF